MNSVKYNGNIEATGFCIPNKTSADILIADGTTLGTSELLSEYCTKAEAASLQAQIDGEISSWFFEGEPTTTNLPASDWTGTDENGVAFDYRQRHEGDTYTNINNATNNHLDNPDIWENGSSTLESGKSYDAVKTNLTTRIRTKELLRNNKSPKKIKVVAGYSVVIRYFDENKIQTTGSSDTWLSEFTLNPNYPYFALAFRKNDNSNITIDVLKSFTQSIFTIEGAFDYDPTAGQSWRWCPGNGEGDTTNTGYHWHKIADSDAVKALQEAAKAQQLANTAQSTANSAQSTANTAQSTANTANTTATNALNTANSAQSTANEVREDFDNLEIGGRNLLKNSNFSGLADGTTYDQSTYWLHFADSQYNGQYSLTVSNGYLKLTSIVESWSATTPRMGFSQTKYNIKGQKYILSFDAYADTPVYIKAETGYGEWEDGLRRQITTNKQRYSIEITGENGGSDNYNVFFLRLDENIKTSVYFNNFKLETGTKATDWTPAPEDVDAAINSKLSLSGGTIQGDILPYISAPPIGNLVATAPGESKPTYISLGSTDNYFEGIYARKFKGLADNALKLYTYGTGIQVQLTPIAINEGNESTPVYFSNGVPVACSIQNTYVKKAGDTMTGALYALAFYETSDVRKKDVKFDLSLDKCYDLIDKCLTIIYSLKGLTQELVGMIAQEIEEFFPEVVATDKDGFKSLAYDRLVVICFKVLKDVIKRLEKLENVE